MSPIAAVNIALSGATAQSRTLSAVASNIANVTTTGPLPGTVGAAGRLGAVYRPIEAVQSSLAGSNGQGAGVRTIFRPVVPPFVAQYSPDQPQANQAGLIAAPNVDLGTNLVTMMIASRAYQANIAAVKAADRMSAQLVNIVT